MTRQITPSPVIGEDEDDVGSGFSRLASIDARENQHQGGEKQFHRESILSLQIVLVQSHIVKRLARLANQGDSRLLVVYPWRLAQRHVWSHGHSRMGSSVGPCRESRQGGRGWTERREGNPDLRGWGCRSLSHNLQQRFGASLRSSPGHPGRTFLQMSSDDDQNQTWRMLLSVRRG